MRGEITSTQMLLVVFLLLALGIFVYSFGSLGSLLHGKCWADAGQTLKKLQNDFYRLEPGESTQVLIKFGGCVQSGFFMNKEDFLNNFGGSRSNLESLFVCTGEEYESMLAIVLRKEDSPGCAASLASQDPKKIGECARYLIGLEEASNCISLIGPNSTFTSPIALEIPSSGVKYCFNIAKETTDKHTILSFDQIKEDSECPEEKPRRLVDII